MKVTRLAVLNTLATLTVAWLPTTDKTITSSNGTDLFKASHGKIRGVNLGSQFVFEPWIATKAWSELGCEGQESEFDCVMKLGQDAANKAFAKHWDSWITKEDIKEIRSYGLNTIRIPVGYWMNEDLIYHDSEYFPHGGFAYLEKLCGWASDAGLYIIIDLHGAPGAQVAKNAFTGQFADTPGFYVDFQYQRALEFLEWMTIKVHTLHNFRNVGMLEVVNEPVQNPQVTTTLRSNYYPNAFHSIRKVEGALSIDRKDYLHIQMMDGAWGAGDPHEHLTDDYYAAYDNHRYLKWDPRVEVSKDSYIKTSCNDNVATNWPAIIGEWSLGVPDNVQETADWKPYSNLDFYQKWFAAQVQNYEQHQGWIFWTWKTQLDEYRWSYRGAEVLLPPAQAPAPHPLVGRTITLHPIQESHTQGLWNIVGGTTDPKKTAVWTYLPEGPYPEDTYTDFKTSIQKKTTSKDPFFYTIFDNRTQKPQGWITLMSIVPEHLRVEIGHVLFAPELQRTTGATEAVYLLLRYAFEELGYRRVEWKCNALNEGSKRAARRLGFVFEGVFREHMVVKGRNRDTAWFSLLKGEWERGVKGGLEGWLHPGNFDESGKQRRGLEDIREGVLGSL